MYDPSRSIMKRTIHHINGEDVSFDMRGYDFAMMCINKYKYSILDYWKLCGTTEIWVKRES